MKKIRQAYLLTIVLFTIVSCRQMWGDNDLGQNFSLLEGDRIEDRVIVYCSGRDFGVCTAGTFIVPVYSRHMDKNGRYNEYVETAKSDDRFIIARTVEVTDKKLNYWIISKELKLDNCDSIDCDAIIQSNVIGPLDDMQFKAKLSDLKISLNFDTN